MKHTFKYMPARLFLSVLVLLVLCVFGQGAAASIDEGPTAQLKPTLDHLITILADETLKGAEKKVERRSLIMDTISAGFDFREMSKRVLGRTWATITPEQRDYFVAQMTKLLENVYIGKLEGYSGQTVEFIGERIKNERAQVTTLVENEGVKLPVHYIMQNIEGKWMVYDINIEGVSLIRNYMEQFKSIIRTEKYEGLIKVIEEKNRFFAENGGE